MGRFEDSLKKMSPQEQYELMRKLERRGTFFEDWVDNKESNEVQSNYSDGDNFLEPLADLIFNAIVAIFPGFKK